MAKKKDENKRVIFRRIGGRVIPITVGGAAAASAANTTRVYKKGNITIDKKKFSFAPVTKTFGSRYNLSVAGKKAANATVAVAKDGEATFGWLGVKKKFQKKGLSKVLSKEAIRDSRRKGATHVFNQVIHPGSALTNYSKGRDTFWRISQRAKADGSVDFFETTKTKAMQKVNKAHKFHKELGAEIAQEARRSLPKYKSGKIRFSTAPKFARQINKKVSRVAEHHIFKMAKADSPIWRNTDLKGMKKITKYSKPFRTTRNKVQLAGGIALVAAGALFGGSNGKKKK